MDSATIAKIGIVFLGLGFAATFLMYWLWGFPFDKETKTSAAPKPLMYLHRALGYLFVICYVAIMWHMVPRLWLYQVEFPARTVAHLMLGITCGFLLLIKISIMRFFRHFEEWMPYLGTAILFCAVSLIVLSVPIVFHGAGLGGDVFTEGNRVRVAHLLPMSGMSDEDLGALIVQREGAEPIADEAELRRGRTLLLRDCVKCHDLKTILSKPRTPSNWRDTVIRMAAKPTLFQPISLEEQRQVTAYLVAITPDLQRSVKQKREREQTLEKLQAAAAERSVMAKAPGGDGGDGGDGEGGDGEGGDGEGGDGAAAPAARRVRDISAGVDPAKAKQTFMDECSLCHEISDVDGEPPTQPTDIDPLVERMIENGMEVEPEDLAVIKAYLLEHYVKKTWK